MPDLWTNALGAATTGEYQTLGQSFALPAGTLARGIVQAHGTGATGQSLMSFQQGAGYEWNDFCAYIEAGLVSFWGDFGHTVYAAPTAGWGLGGNHGMTNFGNDEAITSVGNAVTWMQGGNAPVKTDKVSLVGGSMGCITVCNWARRNPSKVQAILLNIPLIDLYFVYSTNDGNRQGDIATAYALGGDGVGYDPPVSKATWNGTGQPLTTHSILEYCFTDLLFCPIALFSSDNDPNAYTTAQCQSWASQMNAAGGNVVVFSVGSQGHNALGFSAQKAHWLAAQG